MANLTLADTYNMVAFLSKSDASASFDQIVDFLNAQDIQYALMVNPTIYVSCIKQFWTTVSIKKDIFTELARIGYEKPPPKLTFYKAFFSAQWKFLIHTLVQRVSAKRTAWNEFSCSMASAVICLAIGRKFNFSKYIFDSIVRNVDSPSKFLIVGKGFSGVETPLFAIMLVQLQAKVEEDDVETLMETCTTLSHKFAQLEQDKIAQPLEIFKLKMRVKKLEKKMRSKSLGLKRLRKRRKDDDNAAIKDASAAEPIVFDDEEVTMTMTQTLIKIKAEKARLLDEQMAKRLHDEEVEQAAAREKLENDDLEKAKVLQKQYVNKQENIDWNVVVEQMQEKHLDNIRKYQNLKRKPISIAQARKNMIIYLKNMAGYKIEHFKGTTYDKVRPIFEREYNKVQTLFKPNKDVEEPQKKRVAEETLLQERFKKLKAVEVSGSESTQDTPTIDPKEMSEEDFQNMLEVVLVSEFKVEALQVDGLVLVANWCWWRIDVGGGLVVMAVCFHGGVFYPNPNRVNMCDTSAIPTEHKNKYPKKVRVIVFDLDATDSSSDESSENDQSSGKKIVREIVLGVKAGDEKVVKVAQKKPNKVWLGTFKTAKDAAMVYNAKKEEFQTRKMGMNLAVASGSGHDPIRKDESGRVRVGNVSAGMKVVGSGGLGGSGHDPTLEGESGEVRTRNVGMERR
uniref:AP2/ERF domain-containing protein n=1 Tax=Tanacetum cinerariifolium TaxID=118510 RepID=A0A6L2LDA4_TANCI|nr:AP2/ERF domain-containing protein [Tanacetum cinerariifolium]